MKLSVLDQSTAVSGRPQTDAIAESLALARHCDGLGYHRYWVSEHHHSGSIVGSAPEVLMAAIAATTSTIRVGSAGVMLPHYSALKVAEQFRVLEGIAPGRIDLGVGRAPGSDRLTAYALNPDAGQAAERFPQQVQDLQAWVSGMPLAPGHPFGAIRAHPQGPTSPEIWILGSSNYGAQLAAHFGLPYAYAYFFSEGGGRGRSAGPVSQAVPTQRTSSQATGHDLRLGAGGRYRGTGAASAQNPRALAHRLRARPAPAPGFSGRGGGHRL
jgi:luciferase family oxidoreductase group 1